MNQSASVRYALVFVRSALVFFLCGGSEGTFATSIPSQYSVGGTVSGLASGASLVLKNNGTDSLTLSANGLFTFPTSLVTATAYAVTVSNQPVGQTCAVTRGSGTISTANVTTVSINCMALLPTANLLFKSNFSPGVSLGVPRLYKIGNGAWQDIVGKDTETGYSWPVAALGAYFSGVQLITYSPSTSVTIGDHIANQIRQVTGPKGNLVNELFQNVKIKAPVGTGGAQAPLMIQRPWTLGDVKDLYVTYWFKHQPDLVRQLDNTVSAGNWRVQFEFKTGGYENTYAGDYWFITNVMKGPDGKLFWRTSTDNQANGPFDASKKVVAWSEEDHDTPVPVDTWFKYEVSGTAQTTVMVVSGLP